MTSESAPGRTSAIQEGSPGRRPTSIREAAIPQLTRQKSKWLRTGRFLKPRFPRRCRSVAPRWTGPAPAALAEPRVWLPARLRSLEAQALGPPRQRSVPAPEVAERGLVLASVPGELVSPAESVPPAEPGPRAATAGWAISVA